LFSTCGEGFPFRKACSTLLGKFGRLWIKDSRLALLSQLELCGACWTTHHILWHTCRSRPATCRHSSKASSSFLFRCQTIGSRTNLTAQSSSPCLLQRTRRVFGRQSTLGGRSTDPEVRWREWGSPWLWLCPFAWSSKTTSTSAVGRLRFRVISTALVHTCRIGFLANLNTQSCYCPSTWSCGADCLWLSRQLWQLWTKALPGPPSISLWSLSWSLRSCQSTGTRHSTFHNKTLYEWVVWASLQLVASQPSSSFPLLEVGVLLGRPFLFVSWALVLPPTNHSRFIPSPSVSSTLTFLQS